MEKIVIKKILLSILCLFLVGFSFAKSPEEVNVAALNGPSGIGMAYLFETNPDLEGVKSNFEVVASADVLLPKLLKGEVDIGILPPNAAAKVYNKNKGAIVMGAIVGEGMLSIVSTDDSVNSLADLKGKTLTVAGQGATPEYMIRYLAAKEGISLEGGKDGIELDFSIPNAEIAAALAAGKIKNALVPEPFATVACTNAKNCRRAVNIQELWGKDNFPMTVVVINAKFASEYPETVQSFLDAYKDSIYWTNKYPVAAGALVEKHTLGLKAMIAAKAIPNANFTFTYGKDSKAKIESLLSVFLDFAPEAIGGKLPDNKFYFGL